MSMGSRISRLRKSKGFTQEYIAEALGVSRQAVYKWEKDQTCPDTGNLIALASLLGTTVDYLANGNVKQSSDSATRYWKASLIPLILMPLCWLIGMLSGAYTDMVQLPVGNGLRVGLPLLMYGRSTFAIVLVVVSIIGFLLFILLLFLGHQANKE